MADDPKIRHTRYVERRKRYYERLQTTHRMIASLPKNLSIFLVRVDNLPTLFDEFNGVLNVLEEIQAANPELLSEAEQHASKFEELYFTILAVAKDHRKKEDLANQSTSSAGLANVSVVEVKPKLPQISLTKFDGKIENFSSFLSLFNALIHTSTLSDIEKFSYLVAHLEGSALQLVKTVDFQSENYQTAYDLLVNRYTNKRVIANFYLNKLLSLQPIKPDTEISRQLSDSILTTVACIKSVGIPDLSDFILLHLSLRLLDSKTRKGFEDKHLDNDFPTFHQFSNYLLNQSMIADLLNAPVTGKPSLPSSKNNPKDRTQGTKVLLANKSTSEDSPSSPSASALPASAASSCLCCSKPGHQKLSKCERFLSMSVPERKTFIQEKRLCYACFSRHPIAQCKSNFSCRICHRKSHNYLIHPDSVLEDSPPSAVTKGTSQAHSSSNPGSVALANVCPKPSSNCVALLGTATATIFDVTGKPHTCRLVFDSGSQANFITSTLADRLALPRKKCSFEISGVGQSTVHPKVQGSISCKLASRYDPTSVMFLDTAIIPRITSDLPTSPLSPQLQSKFSFLTLADPDFVKPGPVDLLLGIQAVLDATLDNPGPIKGFPCAVPTIFGYVIMGSVPREPAPTVLSSLLVSTTSDPSFHRLEQAITAFWEQEEVGVPRQLSDEDLECERHFQETIARDEAGRYIARLPFVNNIPPTLGTTRGRALKRLLRLEHQFEQNTQYRDLYVSCLRDYVDQGHMVLAEKPVDYLMTHHGVIKGSRDSMKVRVVFNPSEKDPLGVSLNDSLLVGPKKQGDIGEIVTRFRTHKVAVKCDVRQMYRAIGLHPADQEYLHFLWRFSPADPIVEWQLTTITFGVSSSPFTAQSTIAQLVRDEGHRYPLAAEALSSETYIDDIITGASSEEEAQTLCSQLVTLLKLGSFELGKWASSSSSLLSHGLDIVHMPDENSSLEGTKVLGIGWEPNTDLFCCRIDPASVPATKRGILSKVARMYDPNGYFSPVIFSLKALVQQIWLLKLDWDAPLPDHLLSVWEGIEKELPLLEQVRIPRCLLPSPHTDIQLIGFSDASELGMAAVLYLRVETETGVRVSLVKSKTKVAPLKSWTIPRLELGAAHLLARMLQSSQGLIEHLSISSIICFTDSMTTLAWLRTPPYKLKQFVCNRVVQIHEACPSVFWRHVPGKLNPADAGSRGLRPSRIIDNELWWHGPPFLCSPTDYWPEEPKIQFSTLPDVKEPTVLSFLALSDPSPIIRLIQDSSSLLKCQRVIAYMLRMIYNSRLHPSTSASPGRRSGPIAPHEYREAMNVLIQITQVHHFQDDIKLLRGGKECSQKLSALSPFLSPDGFLRVGGRIAWAPISEKAKRPFLLPKNSHLARLLIDHLHKFTAHGGPRLVQSLLHREYWIPSARSLIRQRLHKCVTCVRFAAPTNHPRMADLPKARLTPGRCFTHTGIDFGGPFMIRFSGRRNARTEKGYFALFVCMTTRAVHMEVVSALSTEACLAAIDRFIARRGLPSHIYSDNGRNFRGAAREMSEVHHFLKRASPELESYLAQREISWIFNPPLAPNFGGAWEALIKLAKRHLKRIVGERSLTFEEFATLFARIEAILNSRPLVALPGSPNDPADSLTPGHFLIGAPLLSRPETDVLEDNPNRLQRWQLIAQFVQSFWTRWSKEYLHSLQPRSKWTAATPDLQEGAVVLLKSPNTAPTQWPLGRVEQVFPGSGGAVRVARVKTSSGVLIRPTNKLVVLPVY